MFRALCTLFSVGGGAAIMQPPASAKLLDGEDVAKDPVTLSLTQQGLFSTTVGSSSKKTLAAWHVTSAEEVVDAMLLLVGVQPPKRHIESPSQTPPLETNAASHL
jgi:trehalose 6-phosphate synthase/phosphatase